MRCSRPGRAVAYTTKSRKFNFGKHPARSNQCIRELLLGPYCERPSLRLKEGCWKRSCVPGYSVRYSARLRFPFLYQHFSWYGYVG
jgi:hypothetical protein